MLGKYLDYYHNTYPVDESTSFATEMTVRRIGAILIILSIIIALFYFICCIIDLQLFVDLNKLEATDINVKRAELVRESMISNFVKTFICLSITFLIGVALKIFTNISKLLDLKCQRQLYKNFLLYMTIKNKQKSMNDKSKS